MPEPIPAPEHPPPLAIRRALPRYRFVPGLQPHPKGTDHGGAGLRESDPPTVAWQRGLDLLAHRFPWSAHEAFEQAWLAWRNDDPVRGPAAAGMAKIAACWLRTHAGDRRAAEALWTRANQQLTGLEDPTVQHLLTRTRAFIDGGPWP